MFLHKEHLKHLLRGEHYYSPEHFQAEIDHLFLPAWHLLATRSELGRDGDFLALECFGRQVLLRNFQGEFFAFENVCAHRHCKLTHEPKGWSETLRCQYHGWEYDRTGKTARIPDARCFRPWDRETSHLKTFRVETCGDLIFVALTDQPPALRVWLGPYADLIEREFRCPEWKLGMVWDYDNACNWKVPAENTLESYHVQALHRKFFKDFYPLEEQSQHELTDRYTSLNYLAHTPTEMRQAQVKRWLGGTPSYRYFHLHVHPHLVFVLTDTLNYALMYLPTSPQTVQIRVRLYGYSGLRRDPFSRALAWLVWRIGKKNTLLVHGEDRDIYPDQQTGLEASTHPGVLGIREERIYQFQKYILESLGTPVEAPAESAPPPVRCPGE